MPTVEEHWMMRHAELHLALDELLTDYLMHHDEAQPNTITLTDLMEWSRGQTIHPTGLGVTPGTPRREWEEGWSTSGWVDPW
jgi:hypothetical protein